MPHSNFKWRATKFNLRVGKCSCSQTFERAPKGPGSRDPMCIGKRYEHEASKGPHRGPGSLHDPIHHKFCSKPPRVFDEIRVPKKAMMLREQHSSRSMKG